MSIILLKVVMMNKYLIILLSISVGIISSGCISLGSDQYGDKFYSNILPIEMKEIESQGNCHIDLLVWDPESRHLAFKLIFNPNDIESFEYNWSYSDINSHADRAVKQEGVYKQEGNRVFEFILPENSFTIQISVNIRKRKYLGNYNWSDEIVGSSSVEVTIPNEILTPITSKDWNVSDESKIRFFPKALPEAYRRIQYTRYTNEEGLRKDDGYIYPYITMEDPSNKRVMMELITPDYFDDTLFIDWGDNTKTWGRPGIPFIHTFSEDLDFCKIGIGYYPGSNDVYGNPLFAHRRGVFADLRVDTPYIEDYKEKYNLQGKDYSLRLHHQFIEFIVEGEENYRKAIQFGNIGNRHIQAIVLEQFGDSIDFMFLIPENRSDDLYHVSSFMSRSQHPFKGTGLRYDNNANIAFSWDGYKEIVELNRLLGTIHLHSMGSIIGGWSLFCHEIGHAWGIGIEDQSDPHHWGDSSGNGKLGGFDADTLKVLDDKTISVEEYMTNHNSHKPYSIHELYLMGLASSEEVPPLLILRNAQKNKLLQNEETGLMDIEISVDSIEEMSIEAIIEKYGRREPNFSEAQKEWDSLVVLITDQALSNQQIRNLNLSLEAFSSPQFLIYEEYSPSWTGRKKLDFNFFAATDGRGQMYFYGIDTLSIGASNL